MTMAIVFHGGHCCGIKQLYGFGQNPSTNMPKLSKHMCQYANDGTLIGQLMFFRDEAPAETYLERFNRLVAFWKKSIINGILEAVLADSAAYVDIGVQQSKHWREHVEKAGFKEVSCCHNSNSGNRVTVFHLVKDVKKIPVRKSYY